MKNEELIKRIIQYEKKWNEVNYIDMYENNDVEAFSRLKKLVDEKSIFLISDLVIDLDEICDNARKIGKEKFKEQLNENIKLLQDVYKLLYEVDYNNI